ncbi:uncharacterized protein TNIN_415951 [Trichonephila inaurata madagascariensis]|uniref:Uncharacterized protein n=1 Tax=Trichonephila inaurata madagascariensis TaxID=2747483 RepID=A0A8X6X012_9ARAC|nr:uncharacterized protein TNIN_415951 [Trichonephila inaurata madagascariensis]
MADDVARRREIRKRKILESSEARLKKITSGNTKQHIENNAINSGNNGESQSTTTSFNERSHENIYGNNSQMYDDVSNSEDDDVSVGNFNTLNEKQDNEYQSNECRSRLTANDSQRPLSLNDDFTRSCSPDYYTFPKKVSDAETRSFGRTRSDVRRNSSCAQIMMETLQFSSFSSTFLRFWITVFVAFCIKLFMLSAVLDVKNLLIPFVLLEATFYPLSRFETQASSRPMISSLLSGVLLLCGIPSVFITNCDYLVPIERMRYQSQWIPNRILFVNPYNNSQVEIRSSLDSLQSFTYQDVQNLKCTYSETKDDVWEKK